MTRSRAQWREDEKREYPKHLTSTQLRNYLKVSESTFKRWRTAGKIPPPAATTPSGWALWSPEQVTDILRSL